MDLQLISGYIAVNVGFIIMDPALKNEMFFKWRNCLKPVGKICTSQWVIVQIKGVIV